jgi:succinyl-diaminopimelate desuccinylase
LRVFEEQTGQPGRCIAIGGGTYVHEIEGGVAFGAEFDGSEYNMHGVDEQVPIDELMDDIRIQAAAILALCGA